MDSRLRGNDGGDDAIHFDKSVTWCADSSTVWVKSKAPAQAHESSHLNFFARAPMKALLAVAGGGALGAVARYLVFVAAGHLLGTAFPFGTLIVNIAGSFVMGALSEIMALVWSISNQTRLFLMVGFLGAFTTFSTFSLDFFILYERGRLFLCALYVGVSVVCSIGALFFGMWVFRRLLAPA